ncbi:Bacterial regulatory proteins, luxR family [Roseovarius albus]|uniref:Bacterial regulatory proteins, luxR family n=1 Tax=Roseovarius albus TaxID=1247867 RepID=A0A1X6ZKY8_9RHOB|nr:helix-turn-helix transcriptional regulator [Roseovarius albus]SLN54917.1 Bacterial regulatory proteins, luxR family [Roseovarius albus]
MSRTAILWSLFVLQAFCSLYFLTDTLWDVLWPTSTNRFADSDLIEGLVTIALFFGMIFTGNELRQIQRHQDKLTDQIKVASGAFSEVLEERFQTWSLTKAEREVAILAIKGFSIAEIAELRDTKQGTIKAQCASLYRKADVSGRLQLLSVFIDDLLADDLVGTANASAN